MLAATVLATAAALVAAFAWAHWPTGHVRDGANADLVVVRKSLRVLELYAGSQLLKAFPVSLGGSPIGPKHAAGDRRTPEGTYVLDYRKPDSSFHRALHISYPSAADTAHARVNGVDPGGLIMVHGLPNGLGFIGKLHRLLDWTDGCVALTNSEIDQVWDAVADGTLIKIEP